MTEEVKQKIAEYVNKQKIYVSSEGLENIKSDIEFGYHLRDEEVEGLKKEVERLKGFVSEAFNTAMNNVDSPNLKGKVNYMVLWQQFCSQHNIQ